MTTKYSSKKKLISKNISLKNKKKKKSHHKRIKKKGGYKEPSIVRLTESQLESNEIRNLWEDINLPNVNKLNHIFPYTYPLRNINEYEESKVKDYKWKQNESIPNLLSSDQYFFTNPDFNKNKCKGQQESFINPLDQFRTKIKN